VAITFDDQSTLKLRVTDQATVSVGAKVEAEKKQAKTDAERNDQHLMDGCGRRH
jgi:hypothetical protein